MTHEFDGKKYEQMNSAACPSRVLVTISLLLLSACATRVRGPAVVPASDLPGDVSMSRGAGEGMLVFVKVRLDRGEELPFAVDTGSPSTVVPASWEPILGERLGSRKFSTLDGHDQLEHVYMAPKLYLGNTRLVTGRHVGAWGSFGVLGMDCLRHYCIQLDFQARQMRFLNSDRIQTAELGKPFRISVSKLNYTTISHPGFFQDKDSDLLIDTGCWSDGCVRPRVFDRAMREQHARALPLYKDGVVQGVAPGEALFPECVWENERYTNLILGRKFDLIGLRFLGRHQVTFDFPKGVMYLKRTSDDALANEGPR